jgi:PAS domain S-box-containing protein
MEEALKRDRERFRILIEESPLGVALIDKEGAYKYINPKFSEILGYTLEDIPTGRQWFRKAYPDEKYRKQVISTWIEDQKKYGIGEARPRTYEVTCKDGSKKTIHFRPVTMERGDQLIIYEDITETQRLEEQLLQAQKMEAIGTLAGGIAHDFNNILASIIGYAEIAGFEVDEESKIKKDLNEILNASYRAKDLVKHILAFSRISKQERIPVQMKSIVKETIGLLRASLPVTIEIRQNIESNLATVEAEPTQIQQIIMNLCTNARHAMMEEGGILEISLSEIELDYRTASQYRDLSPGKYVRLTVSDTGIGMEEYVTERIFDPYFTTKEKGVGTGLGLSVVQGIVKSYGGEVTVYSEPGKGTTFRVYIPAIQKEVIGPKDEIEPLPIGTEHILFVDDEPSLVDIGRQMLEHLGYDVTTRTSGIEALELFKAEADRFDLVITDMTMPHMTGDKLAGELMQIRPDIPVIICTGFSEVTSEEKAKRMGIKAFAMKPLVMKDLANIVREALGNK